jgi:hypothetical protein
MAKRISVRLPEIGFVASTRAALGAGLGLLLADRLNPGRRQKVGWGLFAFGAATTVPIFVNLFRRARHPKEVEA